MKQSYSLTTIYKQLPANNCLTLQGTKVRAENNQ